MRFHADIYLKCEHKECTHKTPPKTFSYYYGDDFHDIVGTPYEFLSPYISKYKKEGWFEVPGDDVALCPIHAAKVKAELEEAERKEAEEEDRKKLAEILKRNPSLAKDIK